MSTPSLIMEGITSPSPIMSIRGKKIFGMSDGFEVKSEPLAGSAIGFVDFESEVIIIWIKGSGLQHIFPVVSSYVKNMINIDRGPITVGNSYTAFVMLLHCPFILRVGISI